MQLFAARRVVLTALALAVMTLGAPSSPKLGAREPTPTMSLTWAPGDTVRVVARWGPSTATDVAYATRWATTPVRAGFPVTKGNRTSLSDTVFLAAPENMTDSIRVDFAVWSVRIATNRASRDTSRAFRWFKRADVAPPGPGPAGLDTSSVSQVDSLAVLLADSAITVGDSTLACAVVRVGGRWRLGKPEGRIQSTQVSTTQGRLSLYERPPSSICSAIASARFGISFAIADAWPGIQWSADTSVILNSGGDPGDDSWTRGPLLLRQEYFRARAGRASARASLRAE